VCFLGKKFALPPAEVCMVVKIAANI